MARSASFNRDVSRRKALRKRRIDREIYPDCPYYNNLHQYSKNKIHCSCPDCSTKTKNKGRRKRGNYHRSLNYKKSDLNKMISMDNSMEEFDGTKIKRHYKNW